MWKPYIYIDVYMSYMSLRTRDSSIHPCLFVYRRWNKYIKLHIHSLNLCFKKNHQCQNTKNYFQWWGVRASRTWEEIVLILFPKRRGSKSWRPGCEGSAALFPRHPIFWLFSTVPLNRIVFEEIRVLLKPRHRISFLSLTPTGGSSGGEFHAELMPRTSLFCSWIIRITRLLICCDVFWSHRLFKFRINCEFPSLETLFNLYDWNVSLQRKVLTFCFGPWAADLSFSADNPSIPTWYLQAHSIFLCVFRCLCSVTETLSYILYRIYGAYIHKQSALVAGYQSLL